MTNPRKRPRDFSQAAKLVVDIATGQVPDQPPNPSQKDPNAVERGRLGGLKGGRSRADNMTAAERKDAAGRALAARWAKAKPPS